MKIIKKNDIKRAELAMSVMKKPKNESEKEKQKLKGDIGHPHIIKHIIK